MSVDVRGPINCGPIDWPLPAFCRVPLAVEGEEGLARAAAHERWLHALCVIAWRLNGNGRVKYMGRQRLIARGGFGAVWASWVAGRTDAVCQ